MNIDGWLGFIPIVFALSIFMLAAIVDVRRLTIPNWISLLLILLFPVTVLAIGLPYALITQHIIIGVATFLVGFTLFAFKLFGGGDAKLLAAGALWVDYGAAVEYFLLIGIIGGLLAILLVVLWRVREWLAPRMPIILSIPFRNPAKGCPYGVAIACGAWYALPNTELFQLSLTQTGYFG